MMSLQQQPVPSDESFNKPYKRAESTYENLSKSFITPAVSTRSYGMQYSHLYYTRLRMMKNRVKKAAKTKWGNDYKLVDELKDLVIGEQCVILGTIFKKLNLRPDVLREFSEKQKLIPQPSRAKYSSVNDELILEDTIQRISLCGNISSSELVTGIVVALLGSESDNGRFEVDDICFAGVPAITVTPPLIEVDRYLVLISGLNIGSAWCDLTSIQLMVDYLTGQVGGEMDNEKCSLISRVIIAGNSLSDTPVKSDCNKENKVRFTSRNYTAETTEAMAEFDRILSQISCSMSCDLMPGSHDPSNYHLPHQPLHKCMFTIASTSSSFMRTTNPYHCTIDKIRILGTSGDNINDVMRCSDGVCDPMSILESTLEWNHIIPTAPDTIGCYPYKDEDPFIINECPQIYFAGNQRSYQHKLITDGSGQHPVLLVCVPSFDITHSIVLVNLRNLDCQQLCFGSTLPSRPNPQLMDSMVEGSQLPDLMQELDSDEEI